MNNEEKILAMLEQLQQGQATMQADISILKQSQAVTARDIDNIKYSALVIEKIDRNQAVIEQGQRIANNRLESLEQGQAEMQSDIRQLNQTVAKIEVEHGHKLSVIYDAHADTVRNTDAIKELDAKVEDHGVRIWALEEAVRTK